MPDLRGSAADVSAMTSAANIGIRYQGSFNPAAALTNVLVGNDDNLTIGLSGFTAAFAYMQVMALGKLGEPESRTVFYFALGSAVAGGAAMLVTGVSPWHWQHALWLLPVGLLASLGQLCMTRAYSQGATLVVANLQYSGIVFGVLYSVLLFDDVIPWIGWAGMALIIASGIAATVLRARAAPNAPGEEH